MKISFLFYIPALDSKNIFPEKSLSSKSNSKGRVSVVNRERLRSRRVVVSNDPIRSVSINKYLICINKPGGGNIWLRNFGNLFNVVCGMPDVCSANLCFVFSGSLSYSARTHIFYIIFFLFSVIQSSRFSMAIIVRRISSLNNTRQ